MDEVERIEKVVCVVGEHYGGLVHYSACSIEKKRANLYGEERLPIDETWRNIIGSRGMRWFATFELANRYADLIVEDTQLAGSLCERGPSLLFGTKYVSRLKDITSLHL